MNPWLDDGDLRLYHGDALETVRQLPDESVDCVVTSPPYWGLRDYGTGEWEGGDPECAHNARPLNTRAGRKQQGAGGASHTNTYGFRGSGPGGSNPAYIHSGATPHMPFGDNCGKCGARRVDQQMGLEPTPDLFVQNMVELFREIRRVLAPHGTCWVNLGDSYAAARSYQVRDNKHTEVGNNMASEVPEGLKPKDLVGIPWRVAFALQQPYYAGTIKQEIDRVWLAAMIDAEGCIFIHKRKVGQSNGQGYERKTDSYGSGLEIANTSLAIVERCKELTGKGSIVRQEKDRKQPLYRWNLRSNECRDVLREVYPYLVAKKQQARLAIGCPSSGAQASAAHEALKLLHNGGLTDVDFKAPASMYEPGWYVRSDVIWSKLNPMPESVTDRPTKAHEYVFLLTKQPRYWFDTEAVREAHSSDALERTMNPNHGFGSGEGNGAKRTMHAFGAHPAGRNVRSVWSIATQPYPEAHFATYPEELARRCILAGCPVRVCRVCGKPSERIVDVSHYSSTYGDSRRADVADSNDQKGSRDQFQTHAYAERKRKEVSTVGWSDCGHNQWRPGVVLDPFIGSGTTAKVARDHQRHAIGIDLNQTYLELAARRLQQLSLLNAP